MNVTKEIIRNAITTNDIQTVSNIFEEFELGTDTRPCFTSGDKECVSTILNCASAMCYRGELDHELIAEIINHTAMTVDIFPFLQLVILAAKIENNDFNAIPKAIRSILEKNKYVKDIAHEIESLDDDAFEALLASLIDINKTKGLDVLYAVPIIRHIYERGILSVDILFSYMACSLRDTLDEHLRKAITPNLVGGIMIGPMFDLIEDDEETTDDKDSGEEIDPKADDNKDTTKKGCEECPSKNDTPRCGNCDECYKEPCAYRDSHNPNS